MRADIYRIWIPKKSVLPAWLSGAGRQRKDDIIDPAAGIVLHKKTGDNVEAGETVATLFASDKNLFAEAAEHLSAALNYSAAAPAQKAVVFDTVE